ncbi:MAG: hypothetical protein ACLFV6_03370 [Spirulinaceae cyanobacterium]
MKIIRQTDTSLEIRYLPTDEWIAACIMMIWSFLGILEYMIELDAFLMAGCVLFLLWSIYIFLFSSKIRHCLADQTTQTFYIRDRNLLRTETRQKYFFREISNLEVYEEKGEHGWEYFAYLNLKSGQTIDLAQESMRDLETSLRPLAKLINCSYNFVPQEKSFLD